MTQRLHEPTRPPLLRRRATFFHRGLLVLGPVAVVLVLLVLTPAWPVELQPGEALDARWALASVLALTVAAFGLRRLDHRWARWLMVLGVVAAVAHRFVDPWSKEEPTFAVQIETTAGAFGFAVLLPWIQDSALAHRFRSSRARRRPGGRSVAVPVTVSPDEALGLLQAELPEGFSAGLREGRACAWWSDDVTGRSVVVHTPGHGWVSAEVESGHADVQRGNGGPDALSAALRRALAIAEAYRSGGVGVEDRRTGTPRGGELLVLAADGWHELRRPQQVWAERTARRAWEALRGRRG